MHATERTLAEQLGLPKKIVGNRLLPDQGRARIDLVTSPARSRALRVWGGARLRRIVLCASLRHGPMSSPRYAMRTRSSRSKTAAESCSTILPVSST